MLQWNTNLAALTKQVENSSFHHHLRVTSNVIPLSDFDILPIKSLSVLIAKTFGIVLNHLSFLTDPSVRNKGFHQQKSEPIHI